MTSYLLSWNPGRFAWTDIDADIAALKKNGFAEGRWSCGPRSHLPRDSEVFLIRLGAKPKGIVAHGRTVGDAHQGEHWDEARARRGDRANYVDVRFDKLAREPLVGWEELQRGILSGFRWSIQGSGVELPANVARELRLKLGLGKAPQPGGGASTSDASLLAWRSDPEAVRSVLDRLLAAQSRSVRRAVVESLSQSIKYAHENDSNRWAVSLFDDLIRFNVGMVESVVVAENGLSILVDRDPGLRGVEVIGKAYSRAGGSRLALVPYREATTALPRLREHHEAALRLAAKYPCQLNVQAAHSTGVIQYLESELGSSLPTPDHWTKERATDAAEALLRESTTIPETEKSALIKARIGQGRFREEVANVEMRCRVTGVDDQAHLRASHIKPWCESDNRERLDAYNGLMLAPHVDHLFDKGFISFADDGSLLISPALSQEVLGAWGIPDKLNVGRFRPEQRRYLAYHRAKVLIKA